MIDPTKFIPMAKETGLILPLGRYVLERACQQVRSIRDQVGVDLPISINLSPRQVQESGLLSQVAAALDASGLPSELLIFEITETRQCHGHRDRGRGRGDQGPGRRAPPARLRRGAGLLLLAAAAGPGVRRGAGPSFRPCHAAERPGYLVTAGIGATCAA